MPITVRIKIVSLSDFVAQLCRVTHAHVTVAQADADRKLTAFCVNRPAWEVMEKVAEALFMQWTFDRPSHTWRLELQPRVRQEEAAARQEAIERDRENLRTALVTMQRWARMSPEEQAKEHQPILARLEAARTATGPDASQRLKEAELDRQLIRLQPSAGFGAAWGGRTEEAVARLVSGETLFASSRPEDGLPLLPASDEPLTTFKTEGPAGLVIMVRYRREQSEFEGRGLILGTGLGALRAPFRVRFPEGAKESPLERRMREWGETTDPEVLAKEIDPTIARVTEEGCFVPGFSLSDHLEFLATGAGISIVADAFRTACSPPAPFTATTVDGYLNSLRQSWGGMIPYQPGPIRSNDGWLMLRSHQYWKQLDKEIPERLLRPVERTASQRALTTLDYAALAGALTEGQADWIGQMGAPVLVRFSRTPLTVAMASLRFWSHLTAAERQAAASAHGLGMEDVSAERRAEWARVISESLWQSVLPDGFLSAVLSNSMSSLSLRYREREGLGNSSAESDVFLNSGVPPAMGPCLMVEFGYSDQQDRSFRISYPLESPRSAAPRKRG
ncbi:MAG: hypothetical protein M9921_01710 [Fimbriimonadaceae bacterium]|nr:hypothetical protein [Fimbriimonadaceae bacterium]